MEWESSMPTKLPLPAINDISLINDLIQARTREPNKSYFQSYRATWITRFKEYYSKKGNPEHIAPSAILETDKSKFINLYIHPKAPVDIKILNVLRSHNLDFCPFCGEAGTPATLDHFLPKDEYPEYSIFSSNLVPMCDICQRADAKGVKVLDSNQKRIFFHPYFDGEEDLEILVLEILPPFDKGTSFRLCVKNDIEQNLQSLCSRHIKELNIETRYRRYFSTAFVRLKKLVKKMLSIGVDRESIEGQINSFYVNEKLVATNYWDTIFYKSVLNNAPLMEYLKTLVPEDYEK